MSKKRGRYKNIWFPHEMEIKIIRLCNLKDRTFSEILRHIIDDYFAKVEDRPPE